MSPTALGRVLAAYLRTTRKSCGITSADAAKHIGASISKLSRMETAQTQLQVKDVEALLALCGVREDEREQIAVLVHRAAVPEWWQPYAEVMPEWLQPLVALERDAQTIRSYETQFVPGLLQTRTYAQAVVRSSRRLAGDAERERAVQLRMERQDRVGAPGGPLLWVVLDEGVLYRPVGGTGVMHDQLEHLLAAVDRRAVRLQIATFEATATFTPGGPVSYLRFAPNFLPDMVYLEQMTTGLYMDRREDVDGYRAVLDQLSTRAATPVHSREMLQEMAARYR